MVQVHLKCTELSTNGGLEVRLEAAYEAEIDQQWSYVGDKSNQRWLWYTIDHATNTVLAYMFGKHQNEIFFQTLKTRFQPYLIVRYYTEDITDWVPYQRYLELNKSAITKNRTQKPKFEDMD